MILSHFKSILLVWIAIQFIYSPVIAQQSSSFYQPLSSNIQQQKQFEKELSTHYAHLKKNLPAEHADKVKKILNDLWEDRKTDLEREVFLFDTILLKYIQNLTLEIKKANPELSFLPQKCVLLRDYLPNASTTLDGVISFHVGLLARCRTEADVVFILCHEIAHHELKHPLYSLNKILNTLYSEKGQATIAEAKASGNDYEKGMRLLKDLSYNHSRHSRSFELEADAAALNYMKKTKFNVQQAPLSLLLLDTIDKEIFSPTFDLKTIFNFPQFRFKDRWLEEEEVMFKDGKRVFDGELDKDSAKTHPDCKHRAEILEQKLGKILVENVNQDVDSSFKRIVKIAKYETSISAYRYNSVDMCLFHTLQLLQIYPDDVFLHTLVGKCFNTMFKAQKEHTFSKIVDLATTTKPNTYLPFLRFLNNLNLRELSGISYHCLMRCPTTFQNEEEFLYQLIIATKNFEKTEELTLLKNKYKSTFPNGSYKDIILKL